jgi:hypothetical protein
VSTVRSWGVGATAGTGAGAGPGLSGGSFRKPPDVIEDAEPIEDTFIEDSFYAAISPLQTSAESGST